MSRFGDSRRGTTPSPTHGSPRRPRGDGRLDPVRWRRPGRGTLVRLVAVAALLATAAAVSWSPSPECGASPAGRVVSPAPSRAAQTGSSAGRDRAAPAVPDGAVPSGSVGVPIRLADPTALSLVQVGNRVDLLRVDEAGGQPTAVAAAALVLRVTAADDPTTGGLLLALTPQEAQQAVATSRESYAIVIRPG